MCNSLFAVTSNIFLHFSSLKKHSNPQISDVKLRCAAVEIKVRSHQTCWNQFESMKFKVLIFQKCPLEFVKTLH